MKKKNKITSKKTNYALLNIGELTKVKQEHTLNVINKV